MYFGLKKSSVSIAMLLGIGFYVFGVALMFDRFFLLLGNILFLIGASYSAGWFTLTMFFVKPTKIKGSFCYFSGMFLILIGWSFVGGIVQVLGFYYLFRDFIPHVYASSKYIPGIGPYICSSAVLKDIVAKISGNTKINIV
jgi:Got1/Sft2-like family